MVWSISLGRGNRALGSGSVFLCVGLGFLDGNFLSHPLRALASRTISPFIIIDVLPIGDWPRRMIDICIVFAMHRILYCVCPKSIGDCPISLLRSSMRRYAQLHRSPVLMSQLLDRVTYHLGGGQSLGGGPPLARHALRRRQSCPQGVAGALLVRY